MKKFLPKTAQNHQASTEKSRSGFTLIEILVVVAIISILSIIAIASFRNVASDARDGKRQAELGSISRVLEVNKTPSGYQPILATQFGGGVFPGGGSYAADPSGLPYCINNTGAADPSSDIAGWVGGATPACPLVPSVYSTITGATPTVNSSQWKLCSRLESRGTASVTCRTNQQ